MFKLASAWHVRAAAQVFKSTFTVQADIELGWELRSLNGRPWFDNPDAPARKSVLFAEFEAGATRQQSAHPHQAPARPPRLCAD